MEKAGVDEEITTIHDRFRSFVFKFDNNVSKHSDKIQHQNFTFVSL
jgi:hypothetical protein